MPDKNSQETESVGGLSTQKRKLDGAVSGVYEHQNWLLEKHLEFFDHDKASESVKRVFQALFPGEDPILALYFTNAILKDSELKLVWLMEDKNHIELLETPQFLSKKNELLQKAKNLFDKTCPDPQLNKVDLPSNVENRVKSDSFEVEREGRVVSASDDWDGWDYALAGASILGLAAACFIGYKALNNSDDAELVHSILDIPDS